MSDVPVVECGATGGGRCMPGVTEPPRGRFSVGARCTALRGGRGPASCLAPSAAIRLPKEARAQALKSVAGSFQMPLRVAGLTDIRVIALFEAP